MVVQFLGLMTTERCSEHIAVTVSHWTKPELAMGSCYSQHFSMHITMPSCFSGARLSHRQDVEPASQTMEA